MYKTVILPSPSTPHCHPPLSLHTWQGLPLWCLLTSWDMRGSPYKRPTPSSKRGDPSSDPTLGSGGNSLTTSIVYFKGTPWIWLSGKKTHSFLIFISTSIKICINDCMLITSSHIGCTHTYVYCCLQYGCINIILLCNVYALLHCTNYIQCTCVAAVSTCIL